VILSQCLSILLKDIKMKNKTLYRVIDRYTNEIREFEIPRNVAIYFWGRLVSGYIVVKSDNTGDRVVVFNDYEMNAIKKALIAG
jgi:hypothetical protein